MDMLQAMNTGHPGSMSTIHANSPQDALSRMEVMASMGTAFFSEQALRRLIASAIHLIVQLARLPDGHRRVMSISEVRNFDAGQATLQDIFVFTQQGVDAEGCIYGEFRGCGTAPDCMDHLRSYGQELDAADFHSQLTVK
jgi:pilus assembly protein CpaF